MCARKARNTLNINSQKQHKLPKKYHPNKKHFTKNTLQKTLYKKQNTEHKSPKKTKNNANWHMHFRSVRQLCKQKETIQWHVHFRSVRQL